MEGTTISSLDDKYATSENKDRTLDNVQLMED